MSPRLLSYALLVLAALLAPGCGGSGGGGGGGPDLPPEVGGPIDGLTVDELASFDRGRALFVKRFKPSEGLGPMYNATSCSSCHSTPAPGGSSRLYRNFYIARRGDPTTLNQQFDLPGLPSAVIPAFGPPGDHANATFSLERGRPVIPDGTFMGQPVQVAQRNAPPLFGVGLFEAVSATTMLSLADPTDADNDDISGRVNFDVNQLGRFGVKAQSASIEQFTRPPLMNQMGITSDALPTAFSATSQVSGGGTDFEDGDAAPDPEISAADVQDLVNFCRFLRPPDPRPFDAAALNGQALFISLGCVKCHMPTLPSTRGPVRAYTDLLLHDMGDDLADHLSFGVPQASNIDGPTSHREFRTAPLWGVSLHAPYLHDGRAETLFEAIDMHAGEALGIRDDFLLLSPADRADVIAFLEHL